MSCAHGSMLGRACISYVCMAEPAWSMAGKQLPTSGDVGTAASWTAAHPGPVLSGARLQAAAPPPPSTEYHWRMLGEWRKGKREARKRQQSGGRAPNARMQSAWRCRWRAGAPQGTTAQQWCLSLRVLTLYCRALCEPCTWDGGVQALCVPVKWLGRKGTGQSGPGCEESSLSLHYG